MVDDSAAALAPADVERAVALWVRRVRLVMDAAVMLGGLHSSTSGVWTFTLEQTESLENMTIYFISKFN